MPIFVLVTAFSLCFMFLAVGPYLRARIGEDDFCPWLIKHIYQIQIVNLGLALISLVLIFINASMSAGDETRIILVSAICPMVTACHFYEVVSWSKVRKPVSRSKPVILKKSA